jgi:hypothetical protein
MQTPRRRYSDAERAVLDLARRSALSTDLSERNLKDVFGMALPSRAAFRRLAREGLVFETEEEEILIGGDPFRFTPMIELEDLGRAVLRALEIEDRSPGSGASAAWWDLAGRIALDPERGWAEEIAKLEHLEGAARRPE